MPNRRIKIRRSNSVTGKLTLSDLGYTNARQKDSVTWKIGRRSGVASLTSIPKKPHCTEIFSTLPHQLPAPNERKWKGIIDDDAPTSEYEYSIWWMAKDGSGPHEFDPKISVRPSTFFKKKLILLLLFVVGLLSLGLLRRNKK